MLYHILQFSKFLLEMDGLNTTKVVSWLSMGSEKLFDLEDFSKKKTPPTQNPFLLEQKLSREKFGNTSVTYTKNDKEEKDQTNVGRTSLEMTYSKSIT